MAASPAVESPVVCLWGEDEFAVQRRARQVFDGWRTVHPGAEEEIIDGSASNTDEVMKVLSRLREALQTLPFFGGTKSVWLRGCGFVGDDRVSEVQAVVDAAAGMAREWAAFRWEGVRLLVSAGKIDRRRAFYKTLEKVAAVEYFPGLGAEDRDWREKAETLAAGEFRAAGKRIDGEALATFVEYVGPNTRQLVNEVGKLSAYAGDRDALGLADVQAITTRGRQARAFALGDAVGERDLARALRCLEDELWSMQSDRQKSEIGLLYALIGKVRAMLLAKEMVREGLVRVGHDYRAFASQLKELPADRFATDRRYNPRDINAYVLFRAAQHSSRFTREELVGAMEELLDCNRRLVAGSANGRMALQLALSRIIGRPTTTREAGGRTAPRSKSGP